VPNHIQKMVLNILLKSHSKYKQAYPLSYQLLLRERRGGESFASCFLKRLCDYGLSCIKYVGYARAQKKYALGNCSSV